MYTCVQRVIVKGHMRIGIYAVKDIPAGAALSYDYQFDTSEAASFKCCCGAATCRGTMAPITQAERDRKKYHSLRSGPRMDRADRRQLIERGRALTTKSRAQEVEEEWECCCYLATHVPGDALAEVRNGPPGRTFATARYCHAFLPRCLK